VEEPAADAATGEEEVAAAAGGRVEDEEHLGVAQSRKRSRKKNGRVLGRRKINSLDGLMGLQLYKFQWAYGPNVDGSDREFKRINIRMLYLFREADD
jgi:hypothetical protein